MNDEDIKYHLDVIQKSLREIGVELKYIKKRLHNVEQYTHVIKE